jgi:hypothetical protein
MGLRWTVSLRSETGPDTASVYVTADTNKDAGAAAVVKATRRFGEKQWAVVKVSGASE